VPKGRDGFVQHLSGTAERVAQESGIPASFMLGQAGHETGWGKSEIRHKDGSNSFNLFGIKAGKGWTGKVAEITTTEYINGKAQKVTAKFRAYDSYEDSFRDYARLIKESPRYEKAESVAQSGSAMAYASALQKAGYATDPEYAKKLSGAINSVLRVQRAQA
jgi:flagellar protein FlgJ